MLAPEPAPAGTGQPEGGGSIGGRGQAGPTRRTGMGSRHWLKFDVPVVHEGDNEGLAF